MGWIEKIQSKPQAEKLRIIWAIAVVVVIFLAVVWIISARLHKNAPVDTSVFQTIGQGFSDVKNNLKK